MIASPEPVFSPDSKRLAFAVKSGDKWCVVVDGAEGKQYDTFAGWNVVFSPDSRHFVYLASFGGKLKIFVDNQPRGEYDGSIRAGRIVFNAPADFHVLLTHKDEVFCVSVTIK